jgi:hypothetical protein
MEDPAGRYGKFVEKLDAARNRAKIRLVNFLANNPDWKARWKLLKNYWLQEFSERILTEVSGPGRSTDRDGNKRRPPAPAYNQLYE